MAVFPDQWRKLCITSAEQGIWLGSECESGVYIEKLFKDPAGAGYPRERAESQGQSRKKLAEISKMTHKDLIQILLDTDSEILKAIAGTDSFMEVLEHGGDGAKDVLEYLKQFR